MIFFNISVREMCREQGTDLPFLTGENVILFRATAHFALVKFAEA
jgi:hypothetical protein